MASLFYDDIFEENTRMVLFDELFCTFQVLLSTYQDKQDMLMKKN